MDTIRQGKDVNCLQLMLSIIVPSDILVIIDMSVVESYVLALCLALLPDWCFRRVVPVGLQLKVVLFRQKSLLCLGQ